MFGFVVLNKADASKEDKALYKAHYCGLCHVLGQRYGKKGMMALSYDMVFLDLLLEDLYNEVPVKGKERCKLHPLKEHDYQYSEATGYSADMQMLLYYYSLLDNLKDEGRYKRKAQSYKDAVDILSEKFPRQAKAIKTRLAQIDREEKNGCKDPEKLALIFGRLLGEVFAREDNGFFSSDLRSLGCALGRFIYLIDAWTDRKKDIKNGLFNPFSEKVTEEEVKNMLLDAASAASTYFERLPLDDNLSVLRNILYSGIWCKLNTKEKGDE